MDNSSVDRLNQLTSQLALRLHNAEQRIGHLELTVKSLPNVVVQDSLQQSQPPEQVDDLIAPAATVDEEEISPPPLPTQDTQTNNQSPYDFAQREQSNQKPKTKTELESQIGSFWLNRIGLVALLIGVVSLLLYSFQYFGAGMKIATGFLIGGVFVFLSQFKRDSEQQSWFAHGLNGLGWSITFFTGYAMCFVPDLKLVSDPLLQLIILMGLASATMIDAIRTRSQFAAAMSTSFGAASICLATTTVNPFLALVILVLAAAFVSVRQAWSSLLLVATVAFYAAFNFSLGGTSVPDNIIMVALFGAWAAIHGAVYFAESNSPNTFKNLVWISVINAFCVSGALAADLNRSGMALTSTSYMVPSAALGLLYLVTAQLFKRQGKDDLRTLHILLGLSFVNIAKWIKITGVDCLIADLMQFATLAIAGLRFDIKAFRWFSLLLACSTVFSACSNGLPLSCVALAVYAGTALVYRSRLLSQSLGPTTQALYSNFYLTLANIVAASTVIRAEALDVQWRACLVILQMIANAFLGMKLKDSYTSGLAMLIAIVIYPLYFTLFAMSGTSVWSSALLSVVACYAFAAYCKSLMQSDDMYVRGTKNAFLIFATLVLTSLLLTKVQGNAISIVCGLEGLALVTAGFVAKEKILRILGLITFAITAFHLLFIDFASAPTIARIVSFICTGLILVGCSYAYNWFSKQLSEPGPGHSGDSLGESGTTAQPAHQ